MTSPRRPLTDAEIDLAARLFADAVDYPRVGIFRRSFLPFGLQLPNVVMAPNGNLYLHPKSPLYANCYANCPDLALTGLFIHEMAHVWQHHSGEPVMLKAGLALLGRRNPYAYVLAPDKRLRHYNLEQQAEILKHYFYLKQHPDYARRLGLDPAALPRYEQVLAEFLENPRGAG